MKRYATINTFVDDAFKSHVRENILNPMIVQHNEMGEAITAAELELHRHEERLNDVQTNMVTRLADLSDVPAKIANRYLGTNSSGGLMWKEGPTGGGDGGGSGGGDVDLTPVLDQLDDHENRISAIEMGGGGGGEGGSVNLKPILDRLTVNEGEIDDLQASSADHETRLAAVEAGGNSGGGGEGEGGGNNNAALAAGNVLVHNRCLGATTVVTSGNISQAQTSSTNIIWSSPGRNKTSVVSLCGVVDKGTSPLPSGKIRSGSSVFVGNKGIGVTRVTAPSGCKIFLGSGSGQASLDLASGYSCTMTSMLMGDSSQWYYVENISINTQAPAKAADVTAAITRIEALEAGGGSGGGGGATPLPEGIVPVTNLSMSFKSDTTAYDASDVMSTGFLNVRAANTTITLPPVKTGGNGTTEAKGGEIRYICAYENSVTLAGGTAGDGQQNVSWGGSGTTTKVVPKGTTVGLVAVAIDTGDWSNWQVFSEVTTKL